MILSLHGQLSFTLSPPGELLRGATGDPAFARCDYLMFSLKEIEKGLDAESAWKQGIWKSAEPFTTDDRRLIARTGEILGKSDLETQLTQLHHLAERIEQQAQQAREQAQTQAKLSVTLGALAGLAAVVALI